MLRRILNLSPEGAVAASPAAPVAPSTPAAPAASRSVDGDPFSALDDVMGGPDDSQATPLPSPDKPAAPAAKPRDETGKFTPKPAEEPKPPQSLEELIKDQKTFSKLPKEFRGFAERTAGENKTLSQKIADTEKKIAEYEAKNKDTAKLTDRLAQLEKDLAERDGAIRALKQEASPEFKEKWDKPFAVAKNYANRTIQQLEVHEMGPDGQIRTRMGTWEDFQALYALPLNKASKAAREMFKDDAQTVINHLNEVQRIEYQREEALKEERAQFKEKEAKEVADRKMGQENQERMFREADKQIEQSDSLFQPDPKDPKAAEILTKAKQIWDSMANPEKYGITPMAHAIGIAALKYRAASQPVLLYQNSKLKARVAELEAKLKGSQQADPAEADLGRPGGGDAPPRDENEFDLGSAFTKAMES